MLVVWVESPYTILATEDRDIFGYPRHEIVGSSILRLCGPKSDYSLLQRSIENTEKKKTCTLQLALYDRNGNDKRLMISFEPVLIKNILVGCLVQFRPSFALLLKQVFKDVQETNYPHCLVSAAFPHNIHMVDDRFICALGSSRSDALGKNLLSFLSEKTQSDSIEWSSMLAAASQGAIDQRRMLFRCIHGISEGNVICAPVVENENGNIRHILVLLASHLHESVDADGGDHRLSEIEFESGLTIKNPAILPRRGPCANGQCRKRQPVVLTQAVLNTLRDLPLQEAAHAIGVCATAFKCACRKLGLKRWVYRRRRGRGSGGSGSDRNHRTSSESEEEGTVDASAELRSIPD